MSLLACSECHRHIRRNEIECPFCGARVSSVLAATPERLLPPVRLSRAALLAFAAASVGACGGKETGLGSGTESPGGNAGAGGIAGRGGAGGSAGLVGASGRALDSGGFGAVPYGLSPGGFGNVGGGGGSAPPYGIAPGGFGNVGGIPPIGGSAGTSGSGGTGGISVDAGAPITDAGPDAADARLSGLDCIDLFAGGRPARCCPEPAPDCTGKPNGYPGYACVPAPQSFCSCSCQGQAWICAC